MTVKLLYAREPIQPFAPVAVMVKPNVPAMSGVPEISPVFGFKLKPDGNEPLVTEKVYEPTPPDAEIVWL